MDARDPTDHQQSSPTSLSQVLNGGSVRRRIVVIGRPRRLLTDSYVWLMALKWWQLVAIFGIGFLSFNLVFAFLYWVRPGSLADSSLVGRFETYPDAFFFSVQTVATIGYGVIYPKTLYANTLVTIEIMFGVMGFAMVNGLMFARFSRATARIMFSNVAVIAPHNGIPTLMFRAANQRHNLILEAHVRVALTRMEVSSEGREMRRFRDLSVERRDNLTFILSWTVMHPIDELSPFYGMSAEDVAASDIEIVVVMTGTDESFAQPVYARHVYRATDIVFDRHFADIIGDTEDGRRSIDYSKFHDVDPPL